MRTIIAGSRGFTDYGLVKAVVEAIIYVHRLGITEVVSGMAKGVDMLAVQWANEVGLPYKPFPANWDKHGKKAGYLRNVDMAEYADILIAIWDGISRGTEHMVRIATEHGLLVFTKTVVIDQPSFSPPVTYKGL